jgi:hypothetical protein
MTTPVRQSSFLIAVLLLAAGCASTFGVSPDSLTEPTNKSSFTLDADITFPFGKNIHGNPVSTGLSSGEYVAAYESPDGTYYVGTSGSVLMVNLSGAGTALKGPGGIWLPTAPSKAPFLWRYVEDPEPLKQQMGPVISALSSMEEGRLKPLPGKVDQALLDAIHIVRR